MVAFVADQILKLGWFVFCSDFEALCFMVDFVVRSDSKVRLVFVLLFWNFLFYRWNYITGLEMHVFIFIHCNFSVRLM
jgi:hypothetical protein